MGSVPELGALYHTQPVTSNETVYCSLLGNNPVKYCAKKWDVHHVGFRVLFSRTSESIYIRQVSIPIIGVPARKKETTFINMITTHNVRLHII